MATMKRDRGNYLKIFNFFYQFDYFFRRIQSDELPFLLLADLFYALLHICICKFHDGSTVSVRVYIFIWLLDDIGSQTSEVGDVILERCAVHLVHIRCSLEVVQLINSWRFGGRMIRSANYAANCINPLQRSKNSQKFSHLQGILYRLGWVYSF